MVKIQCRFSSTKLGKTQSDITKSVNLATLNDPNACLNPLSYLYLLYSFCCFLYMQFFFKFVKMKQTWLVPADATSETLFPWQMFRKSLFSSSISSKIYWSYTTCDFHGVESSSFPPCWNCSDFASRTATSVK